MEGKFRVYDNDVEKLITDIDKKAREFDPVKYGLPPINFRTLIYSWLLDVSFIRERRKENEKRN